MKSFTKREIGLIVVMLAAIIFVTVYAVHVRQAQSVRDASNMASLRTKEAQLSELTNYNATICAEYRKLYDAYKKVSAQTPAAGGIGYALPGSAKGEVDQCYQPK